MNYDKKELQFKTNTFELKEAPKEDDKCFYIQGYASTFGNKDRADDVIKKGAFLESIKEFKPKFLWQHKHDMPIGIIEKIYEDEIGLFIKVKLPKDDKFVSGQIIPQMRIGSVSDFSIGFNVKEFEMNGEDEDYVRVITQVKLWEVSLVTIPANPSANVTSFKSASMSDLNKIKTVKDAERFFKDNGFTNTQAKTAISRLKKVFRSEVEDTAQKSKVLTNDDLKELINQLEKI